MEKEIVVVFKYEKETKNTFRYKETPEPGKPPVVGTLYIQKWALGDKPPALLTVIITIGE